MDYIVWDMDRIIFQIYGPFGIRWYSLFFLTGFLIGLNVFQKMARSEGQDDSYADNLLFYLIIGTIVGARLGHCLFYQPEFFLRYPLEILKVWEGGLASHGGFLGVICAIWLFVSKNKSLSFLWVADRISFLALMTGGFIRIGNLFNSEIVGRITDVPWAIIFKKVDSYPRHPSQLYEAIGYFTISLCVYSYYRYCNRRPLEGRLLGLTLAGGFAFRSFIEIFKENQVSFEENMLMNMGQLLSIPFILLGLYLAVGLQKKKVQIKDKANSKLSYKV
ncbi:MAG: prolipoprotein diacylglyceryl transferase [Zetaproteobacteria bacterium]|nr:prolipoprotein diacylglyceryl transferase [Pseudobdellovibrionaceae bacterium]